MLIYFTCMLLLLLTTQSNGTVQMFKNINVISTYNVYTVKQDSMMKNKRLSLSLLVSYAGAWLSRFRITEYCGFVVELFVYSVGRERHETGTSLIMDLLQQPRLNKQVAALCVSPRSQLRPLTAHFIANFQIFRCI